MNKNILKIVVALVVCALLAFGVNAWNKSKNPVVEGSKTITVELYVGGELAGSFEAKTDAEYLGDFLKECVEKGTLKMEYQDSQYGMYITGLGTNELYAQDESAGLYWVYESPDNHACQLAGYCDAANLVPIEDGNHFVFNLASF